MLLHQIQSTLYVATAYVDTACGPVGDRRLDGAAVVDIGRDAVDVGERRHTHPQRDLLTRSRARNKITCSKAPVEEHLGTRVRSFAYRHGQSSPSVRRLVRAAGFDSACAVDDAFRRPDEDVFRLSGFLVRSTRSAHDVGDWVAGVGAPLAPRRERPQTRAWRVYRRGGVSTRVKQEWAL